ncbi:MAG: arginine N-succinyltransferase, partial [Okeania sp. SIO3B3]|nr:arginine N-succinyltransferase [Okeania sp. SIO3B3]
MFYIREARPDDVPTLVELARTVNFINLPPYEKVIRRIVEESAAGFDATRSGSAPPPGDRRASRKYVFVLAEPESDECVGTSSLRAGMGDSENPNLSFQLVKVSRRSSDLLPDISDDDSDDPRPLIAGRVEHIIARLYSDRSSPTELGGLLLPPERRGGGLGKMLSWIRFHYIKRKRPWFSDNLLAEMMAPLDPYNDGNYFWRHVIRKFINLRYDDADRLSTRRREFMYTLLPHTVNLSLLPDVVLDQLGKVNRVTEPAKRLLEEIGFRYVHRVDPFDAGPHMESSTDGVTVVRATDRFVFSGSFDPSGAAEQFDPTEPKGDFVPITTAGERGLVSVERPDTGVRAVNARFHIDEHDGDPNTPRGLRVSLDAARTLRL